MATIDDLMQPSISQLSPEELYELIKLRRSSRRELSSVKKAHLSKTSTPRRSKAPSIQELTKDMSIEALERLIASMEERLK